MRILRDALLWCGDIDMAQRRDRSAVILTAVPLLLGLAALLVLGLWIPAGLDTILRQSVAVIG